MKGEGKKTLFAAMILVGTIIGVGIFGIPYAMSQVGLLPAIGFFVVLGGIQLLQHLFCAEAILAAPVRCRLPGLTGLFFGAQWRRLAVFVEVAALWGAVVAYIIVGGTFLHMLLSPLLGGEPLAYQMAWGFIGALMVYQGSTVVRRVEVVTTALLVACMAMLLIATVGHVRPEYWMMYSGEHPLLPYGVILFSLSGLSAISSMVEITGGQKKPLRRAIVLGTLGGALLTFLFGAAIYGVTGLGTSDNALVGLMTVLGPGIVLAAATFGLLSVTTSFFSTGLYLKETFELDYKYSRLTSWMIAMVIPFGLFIISNQEFVRVIDFSGAVFGGAIAIMVSALYLYVKRHKLIKDSPLAISPFWAYLAISVLSAGILMRVARTAAEVWGLR